MIGPDHKTSCTPVEFKNLVDAIRIAETSLGNPVKQIQDEETQMREVSRKSLFLFKNVDKNSIIQKSDLVLRRPGNGIKANLLKKIIGKKATTDLKKDHMLKFGDFTE